MRTGPTNGQLRELINDLHRHASKEKQAIWRRVADDLSKPTRQRRVVNISRINRHSKENETIIVPGKVLGSGALQHGVTVAAQSFSESARKSIEAKGKALSITELLKLNPKGKDVRIIG